jgi:hypothetical protein
MTFSVWFEKFPGMGNETPRPMGVLLGGSRATGSDRAGSRSRPRLIAHRRRPAWIKTATLLAAAGLALAACSSSGHAGAAPPTTTSTTAGAEQQVLSSWAAAQRAIAQAEVHGDPNWPALFQTMVNPELAHVQAVIHIVKQQGYTAKGDIHVIQSRVTSFSPTRAIVQGCVYDTVIAYQQNGQPAPGNAGKATYGVEQGTMVPAGSSWALEDGTAQQFDTAQQAGSACAS